MARSRRLLLVGGVLGFLIVSLIFLSSNDAARAKRQQEELLSKIGSSPAPPPFPLRRNRSAAAAPWRVLFITWVGFEDYERVAAAQATWLAELPAGVSMLYFTTPTDVALASGFPSRSNIIVLPNATKSYPPQSIMFEAMRYIGHHLLGQFDFLVRVDSDVFVNVDKLLALLRAIHPSELHYIGAPGKGRGEAAKKIGLPNDFCLGGSGVIFSRAVVEKMGPQIDTCMASVTMPNEDTELARCVWHTTRVWCQMQGFLPAQLRQMFYNIYLSVPATIGRLTSGLPDRLPSVALDAIILHPIRTYAEFHRVHSAVRRGLRPLMLTASPYTNEKAIFRTACTHNPVAQTMAMCHTNHSLTAALCPWLRMRRCPAPEPALHPLGLLAPGWQQYTALYFYGTAKPKGGTVECLTAALLAGGIVNTPIAAAAVATPPLATTTTHELAALRTIFVDAITRSIPMVLAVHVDSLPSVTVAADIHDQLQSPGCGGHLLTEHGGVVLLSPPTASFSTVAQTLLGPSRQGGLIAQDRRCHDAPLLGSSFTAALFHSNTLPFLIQIIDSDSPHATTVADLIQALLHIGFPVRYATKPAFTHPRAVSYVKDVAPTHAFVSPCEIIKVQPKPARQARIDYHT